jgi:predicted RNase H-like HicB family nuclease
MERKFIIYYNTKVGWVCDVYNSIGCFYSAQGETPEEALQKGKNAIE